MIRTPWRLRAPVHGRKPAPSPGRRGWWQSALPGSRNRTTVMPPPISPHIALPPAGPGDHPACRKDAMKPTAWATATGSAPPTVWHPPCAPMPRKIASHSCRGAVSALSRPACALHHHSMPPICRIQSRPARAKPADVLWLAIPCSFSPHRPRRPMPAPPSRVTACRFAMEKPLEKHCKRPNSAGFPSTAVDRGAFPPALPLTEADAQAAGNALHAYGSSRKLGRGGRDPADDGSGSDSPSYRARPGKRNSDPVTMIWPAASWIPDGGAGSGKLRS